jgi:GNAT superfamily N-acetyltransferase
VAVRVASERDLDGVAATLTAAFEADPLWSWAFPHEGLAEFWRLFVSSALRYPWVWIAGELVGSRAPEVLSLFERLDHAHPDEPPHYYLSLLGTHPDHRGKGLGMALLAENLALIDSERMPAYLESSNPQNDPRYERLGFVRVGEFQRPDGWLTCSTMWREAR